MTRALTLPALLAAALVLSAPVPAQVSPDAERDLEEGFDLFADGARHFMQGLMDEMLPVLRDLRGLVDDLSNYEAPELLPNGDIIIRRKPEPLGPPEEGEIDI